jgi:hypothetical protein
MKLATELRLDRLLFACLAVVLVAVAVSGSLPCQVVSAGDLSSRLRQVMAAGLGCLWCAALVIGIRRRIPVVRLLAGVFVASAAFWAIATVSVSYLNCTLDRSPPRSCSAVVTWRGWLGRGKGPSRFALKVSRTPSVAKETLVYVDWQHHFTLDVGAPVVVTTYAGALGDEWCAEDAEECVRSP